jgi:hypothetical protein
MRKKSDAIMRRIPDRHERFAPSMIDRFKFTFSSPAPSSPSLQRHSSVTSQTKALPGPNGVGAAATTAGSAMVDGKEGAALVNGVESSASSLSNAGLSGTSQGAATSAGTTSTQGTTAASTTAAATTTPVPSAAAAREGTAEAETKVTFKMGWSDKAFEDRPALERSAEAMGAFVSLNQQMDDFLSSLELGNLFIGGNMGAAGSAAFSTPPTSSKMITASPETIIRPASAPIPGFHPGPSETAITSVANNAAASAALVSVMPTMQRPRSFSNVPTTSTITTTAVVPSAPSFSMAPPAPPVVLDVNQMLKQLVDEDEELAVWRIVNDETIAAGGLLADGATSGDESVSGVVAKSTPVTVATTTTVAPDGTVIKRSDSPDPTSLELLSKKRKRYV